MIIEERNQGCKLDIAQTRPWLLLLIFIPAALLALVLSACSPFGGGSLLSNVTASTDRIVPGSSGVGNPPGAIEVRYTLQEDAHVLARVDGLRAGTILQDSDLPAGEHVVRFTGVTTTTRPMDGYTIVRDLLPAGGYRVAITAQNAHVPGGSHADVPFTLDSPTTSPPALSNLAIRPDTISPNSDAVDDVAELTFRTEQTATISVHLTDAKSKETLVFAPQQKGPGEQNIALNGQDLLGDTLPDGNYTATLRLEDRAGNRVEAQRALQVEGGGEPAIDVLKVEVSPQQIMLGNSIEVSMTVKNVGNVPLRSQGPDRGYTYTTNDSYSSIEGGKWVDRAGLWRVGVDWDGNSGGAAYRYPFRWGFGKTLMPGETVTTGGKITILKQERKMWFFAGVLQEGIRIVRDRLGITAVEVGF